MPDSAVEFLVGCSAWLEQLWCLFVTGSGNISSLNHQLCMGVPFIQELGCFLSHHFILGLSQQGCKCRVDALG